MSKEVQASSFPDKEEQLLIIEGWMETETIKDDQEANEALKQKIKEILPLLIKKVNAVL